MKLLSFNKNLTNNYSSRHYAYLIAWSVFIYEFNILIGDMICIYVSIAQNGCMYMITCRAFDINAEPNKQEIGK